MEWDQRLWKNKEKHASPSSQLSMALGNSEKHLRTRVVIESPASNNSAEPTGAHPAAEHLPRNFIPCSTASNDDTLAPIDANTVGIEGNRAP